MKRNEFIGKVDERLRMVRAEYDFNQEKMAEILGISKKTLVQIEKGRSSLGWTGAVALCTIFARSEILNAAFGGDTTDIILALAFEGEEPDYPKTLGGKVWWKTLEQSGHYKIQQNIISQHYRILDREDRRICASFELEKMKNTLRGFVEKEE
ncbi:helix-turn-helix domain-containing protein [Clostridiales bacterium BAD-6]|uniref:Helix-turn-helix domain-containing protein n=2 Tax=Sinanaerobacter chloroacetimidivorans TaxID=2818044 RepID=A0A8J8B3C7_9FIRM|nr:helix-turn-helix domain-containing protein [Sinanaerobacter chloroacetimidivorans]